MTRITVSLLATWLCAPISAQVTQRVSVIMDGAQGNGDSSFVSISADGRFVAFDSVASNLVPGDTNGTSDIFVRDRRGGAIERVSVDSVGAQGNNASYFPSISADGRFVAFGSYATNLVPSDSNGQPDIFVRDRQSGTTERVSVASGGAQGIGASSLTSISADGRYVAFVSSARNLVPGDTNGQQDIFVHDRQSGTTGRVSVASGGAQANSFSDYPSISADGRFVAFQSFASSLVPGDSNGTWDVFVRDLLGDTTERVSVDSGGAEGNGSSERPAISGDGRYVGFDSGATNLVLGDTNARNDVFVHDRQGAATERVSVDSGGVQGNDVSSNASISSDGRCVAFASNATNLVPGDTNGFLDVFVHDRQSGATERVSINSAGAQGSGGSHNSTISADGREVAFWSLAGNLVPGDTNGRSDGFVRDRVGGTSFTSLCDPGVGGVMACPCSNPPGGPGRGCDNSAASGGAILSASGGTYLSSDSLVFATRDEKPTATSIVLQGSASAAAGIVYGQGVRCVGGSLKRLFTKIASSGSITAPDFVAGDPSVSARSAAKGDPIQLGQSRWYLVYYRDPTVSGGCPATSTFNATQTGVVSWSP